MNALFPTIEALEYIREVWGVGQKRRYQPDPVGPQNGHARRGSWVRSIALRRFGGLLSVRFDESFGFIESMARIFQSQCLQGAAALRSRDLALLGSLRIPRGNLLGQSPFRKRRPNQPIHSRSRASPGFTCALSRRGSESDQNSDAVAHRQIPEKQAVRVDDDVLPIDLQTRYGRICGDGKVHRGSPRRVGDRWR